jgi:hypothetical protein
MSVEANGKIKEIKYSVNNDDGFFASLSIKKEA